MISVDDKLKIHELYSRYNHAADFGTGQEWASCFTEDGVFVGRTEVNGRQALAAYMGERVAARGESPHVGAQHWNNNILLEADGDVVSGRCYLLRAAQERASGRLEVVTLARYEDAIVQVEGEWLFRKRTAILD